jgi:hypothetical protein
MKFIFSKNIIFRISSFFNFLFIMNVSTHSAYLVKTWYPGNPNSLKYEIHPERSPKKFPGMQQRVVDIAEGYSSFEKARNRIFNKHPNKLIRKGSLFREINLDEI